MAALYIQNGGIKDEATKERTGQLLALVDPWIKYTLHAREQDMGEREARMAACFEITLSGM